jgi:hypothetical protein
MDDETRKGVLGEAIMDELKAIRELVSDVPVISRKVSKLEEDVAILKTDVVTIKAVVTDHSKY